MKKYLWIALAVLALFLFAGPIILLFQLLSYILALGIFGLIVVVVILVSFSLLAGKPNGG